MRPFGVGGRPRKPRPLVNTTPRICVYDLGKVANAPLRPLARETTVRVLIDGRLEVLDVVRDPRIKADGQNYFLCPDCSRRTWHLYLRDGRLTCRKCAGLTYAFTKRRGLHRARRLPRKLGAPGLFGPLPARPKHWRRDYWARTIAQLAAAEGLVAAQLRAIIPRVRRRLKHEHRDRDDGDGTAR